jgi:hypothetical protein
MLAMFLVVASVARSQGRAGDVHGGLFGGSLKYSGEQMDDLFGPAGGVSLGIRAMDRLFLDARVVLGEYRWKITPTKIAAEPDYFGPGAQLGDRYPGTNTLIDSVNVSSTAMVDIVANYVLVPGLPAAPFLTAGIGLLSFDPRNASEYAPLPNNIQGTYSTSVASIILGGGVRFPLSRRVNLVLQAERRLVFSQFLDDVNPKRSNDGLTMISMGLSYTFNKMSPRSRRHQHDDRGGNGQCDAENPAEECLPHRGAPPGWDEVFERQDEECAECTSCTMCPSCDECVHVKCNVCLCCYCRTCSACCCMPCPMKAGAGGGATNAEDKAEGQEPEPADPSEEEAEPAPAPKQSPKPSPKPAPEPPKPDGVEPMSVPCPAGQHRECFGPPGFGICVDNEPPRGPQKIRWDLARTLEDGSLLRESESDGRWYRKQVMADGTERISKGTLPFEPSDCKECREKMK